MKVREKCKWDPRDKVLMYRNANLTCVADLVWNTIEHDRILSNTYAARPAHGSVSPCLMRKQRNTYLSFDENEEVCIKCTGNEEVIMTTRPVVIAGAGPCGLVAALTLEKSAGIPYIIYEKTTADKLCSNAGSGIDMAPTGR